MEPNSEKSDRTLNPVIAIDGQRVRSIREEKKLTQLYVASVVGVTTDTISRWENNRYPAIKRDNAEKLAAALEVPVADIIRKQEEEKPSGEPEPEEGKARKLLVVAALMVMVLGAALLLFRFKGPPLKAARWLPRHAAPGQVVPVRITVARTGAGDRGFIVRETLPAGWHPVKASPPAAPEQAPGNELKWLVPGGTGAVTIAYTAVAPPSAPLSTAAPFSGSIVVHAGGLTQPREIGGDRSTVISNFHWADANGDSRIDDSEIMPAYYLTEEMKGLGLDWNGIEAVWSAKGYRLDLKTGRFVPL